MGFRMTRGTTPSILIHIPHILSSPVNERIQIFMKPSERFLEL